MYLLSHFKDFLVVLKEGEIVHIPGVALDFAVLGIEAPLELFAWLLDEEVALRNLVCLTLHTGECGSFLVSNTNCNTSIMLFLPLCIQSLVSSVEELVICEAVSS